MKSSRALGFIGLVLVCATAGAPAATINYADFSNVSGLQLNGSASQNGNAMQLTPAAQWQSGSAFTTAPVGMDAGTSFSSHFRFRIADGGATDGTGVGGDGLAFVIQSAGSQVGGAGGGIGYGGVSPSLAVEFDTWNNGPGDLWSGNHVGINLNGNLSSVALAVEPASFSLGLLNFTSFWSVWVDYSGSTDLLEVRWAQVSVFGPQNAVRPAAAQLSYVVDIPSLLGPNGAHLGFTSSTGGAYANHSVLSWGFDSTSPNAGAVPEASSTLLLFFLATGGLAAARRWCLA